MDQNDESFLSKIKHIGSEIELLEKDVYHRIRYLEQEVRRLENKVQEQDKVIFELHMQLQSESTKQWKNQKMEKKQEPPSPPPPSPQLIDYILPQPLENYNFSLVLPLRNIKKGSYTFLQNEPCKIVDVKIPMGGRIKTINVTGLSLRSNKKYVEMIPVDRYCLVFEIQRQDVLINLETAKSDVRSKKICDSSGQATIILDEFINGQEVTDKLLDLLENESEMKNTESIAVTLITFPVKLQETEYRSFTIIYCWERTLKS